MYKFKLYITHCSDNVLKNKKIMYIYISNIYYFYNYITLKLL